MATKSISICQGYLSRDPDCVVRVRVAEDTGFLTVKGRNYSAGSEGGICDMRPEFEYKIPANDAKEMLKMKGGSVIEKTRYIVPFKGFIWEVDEFHGCRNGLTIAEIELQSPDQTYALPPFVGDNVTGDPKYYNSNL